MARVTVAICTYNGMHRIGAVLRGLREQESADGLFEVLVVDNASTDLTARAAKEAWAASRVPLEVQLEPRQGLLHARNRALAMARSEFVAFIDDDNIVAPDWVRTAVQTMDAHPKVGACGGLNRPDLNGPVPSWFAPLAHLYAVGAQGPPDGGDVTDARGFLWGAGLCLRVSAWNQLRDAGFAPQLTGRIGGQVTSGEDAELCLALRLASWRLWYEPTLVLTHRIAGNRLSGAYLRSLARGDGAASILLDPYHFALAIQSLTSGHVNRWGWRFLSAIGALVPRAAAVARSQASMAPDSTYVAAQYHLGRALALATCKREYRLGHQRVRALAARLAAQRATSRDTETPDPSSSDLL